MAKLDLNDEDEKSLVDGIFWNAMDSLSEDDKKLPQVRFTTILFGNFIEPK
jgi:ATP-dependent RNA helicase DOB1